MMAMQASPKATLDCVDAFGTTDFRADMAAFHVPTLVIHGTADKTVPIDATGREAARMITGAELIEYDGGSFKIVLPAPYRDKDAPTWELVVSLIRNSGNVNRDTDLLKLRLRMAERKIAHAQKSIKNAGRQPWEFGL